MMKLTQFFKANAISFQKSSHSLQQFFSFFFNINKMKKDNQMGSNQVQAKKNSFMQSFKQIFCPCLLPSHLSPLRNNHLSFRPLQSPQNSVRQSATYQERQIAESYKVKQKKSEFNKKGTLIAQLQMKRESLLDKVASKKDSSDLVSHEGISARRSLGNTKWDFSINSLAQKEILSVGINDRHILIKIDSIYLSPNPVALKKQLSQSRSFKKQDKSNNSDIDRYWVQRYALFERFDQGIKLDEKAWRATPPGPVCEWIAGKCGAAKLIIDAFAGVGGCCIRMACICKKIIANDWSKRRLECTSNNAKVYEVDRCLQLSENDFLSVQRSGIDVVFAQPPLRNLQSKSNGSLSIVDFQPTLDKIISKSLTLAKNLILLLPAAISIDVLCSCINKCATDRQNMKDTCSAKVQKIYWQGELRYVLVSMGRIVQEEIKLNNQLDFIYSKLQGVEKSAFRHKKFIKYLRQQYGMIFLLNLLKQSEKKHKQKSKNSAQKMLDIFFQIIKQRSLIPKQKFQKLIMQIDSPAKVRQSQVKSATKQQQEIPLESVMMEEEKVNEDMTYLRRTEQTQSEFSHYSYFSSLEKPLIQGHQPRIHGESYGSIIIKRTLNGSRQKRSISPNSPLSPQTPRRVKNKQSPKNRASQITVQIKKVQQKVSKDY